MNPIELHKNPKLEAVREDIKKELKKDMEEGLKQLDLPEQKFLKMESLKEDIPKKAYKEIKEIFKSKFRPAELIDGDEYREKGKQLRNFVPRKSHAGWTAPDNRKDPLELLKKQNESRVPELIPLRYERMSVSPFTFYRGGALIMASDLDNTPTTGIYVQACGDAHISNFGFFSSLDRKLVFDINDFDETAPGPWEWDLKRLATSVEICGRDRGFTREQINEAVLACAESYRIAMEQFCKMSAMDVWYDRIDNDSIVAGINDDVQIKRAKKVITKALKKNNSRAIERLTEVVDGNLRIISNPPVVVPLQEILHGVGGRKLCEDMSRFVGDILKAYRKTLPPERRLLLDQYHGVDAARKVVGVGSVGTRAWIVVLQGQTPRDYLVLQIKEAQESVLERFCGKTHHAQHGQRVVEGQHAIQTSSDIMLGWCRLPDKNGKMIDYYVRQLWDGKGSFDLDTINPEGLAILAGTCAWVLAHAHARTGNRFAISGYIGKKNTFDKAIQKFCYDYANQNEKDYERFIAALASGEIYK